MRTERELRQVWSCGSVVTILIATGVLLSSIAEAAEPKAITQEVPTPRAKDARDGKDVLKPGFKDTRDGKDVLKPGFKDARDKDVLRPRLRGAGEGGVLRPRLRDEAQPVLVEFGTPRVTGPLTPSSVASEVGSRKGTLEACYRRSLGGSSHPRGELDVSWTVKADGRIEDVSIVAGKEWRTLAGCIDALISRWRFSSFEGENARVTVPMTFLPLAHRPPAHPSPPNRP